MASGAEDQRTDRASGLHGMAQIADTNGEGHSYRVRGDVGFGGNRAGASAHVRLDAQYGFALGGDENHFFGRIGLLGAAEKDPVTKHFTLELPTIFFGFQHHGEAGTHFDIGPRFALGVAGRTAAPPVRRDLDAEHDFVAAPEVGFGALLMTDWVALEFTFMRIFESERLSVAWGSGCVGVGFGLCVDIRHTTAEFGPQWDSTTYYGIRFGLGLIHGRSPPL